LLVDVKPATSQAFGLDDEVDVGMGITSSRADSPSNARAERSMS